MTIEGPNDVDRSCANCEDRCKLIGKPAESGCGRWVISNRLVVEALRSSLAACEADLAASNTSRAEAILAGIRVSVQLTRAEADLAAARAEVERLTRERDEALMERDHLGELASEFMGHYNAKATEIMANECEACKEMAPAFADSLGRQRDASIARERTLRASLAECVEAMRLWGAEEDGIPEELGKASKPFASWEKAKALLSDAAPSPACPSCERMRNVRPEVLAFAAEMEAKLRENDYKGGWKTCSAAHLLSRIRDELQELTHAVGELEPPAVLSESADVANFAMMIADVSGGLCSEADAALAHAEGETHEARWAKAGYRVTWNDLHRKYEVEWTEETHTPDTAELTYCSKWLPTVAAVDAWIAARAEKEGGR